MGHTPGNTSSKLGPHFSCGLGREAGTHNPIPIHRPTKVPSSEGSLCQPQQRHAHRLVRPPCAPCTCAPSHQVCVMGTFLFKPGPCLSAIRAFATRQPFLVSGITLSDVSSKFALTMCFPRGTWLCGSSPISSNRWPQTFGLQLSNTKKKSSGLGVHLCYDL